MRHRSFYIKYMCQSPEIDDIFGKMSQIESKFNEANFVVRNIDHLVRRNLFHSGRTSVGLLALWCSSWTRDLSN